MSSTQYSPPGRLGNPSLDLSHDPRTHPSLKVVLDAMGIGANATQGIAPEAVNLESMKVICEQTNAMITGMYESADYSVPGDENEGEVEESVVEIEGVDGNVVKLYVTKPKGMNSEERLPGCVYIHGMYICLSCIFRLMCVVCVR